MRAAAAAARAAAGAALAPRLRKAAGSLPLPHER